MSVSPLFSSIEVGNIDVGLNPSLPPTRRAGGGHILASPARIDPDILPHLPRPITCAAVNHTTLDFDLTSSRANLTKTNGMSALPKAIGAGVLVRNLTSILLEPHPFRDGHLARAPASVASHPRRPRTLTIWAQVCHG
jgi:hypothetical protein